MRRTRPNDEIRRSGTRTRLLSRRDVFIVGQAFSWHLTAWGRREYEANWAPPCGVGQTTSAGDLALVDMATRATSSLCPGKFGCRATRSTSSATRSERPQGRAVRGHRVSPGRSGRGRPGRIGPLSRRRSSASWRSRRVPGSHYVAPTPDDRAMSGIEAELAEPQGAWSPKGSSSRPTLVRTTTDSRCCARWGSATDRELPSLAHRARGARGPLRDRYFPDDFLVVIDEGGFALRYPAPGSTRVTGGRRHVSRRFRLLGHGQPPLRFDGSSSAASPHILPVATPPPTSSRFPEVREIVPADGWSTPRSFSGLEGRSTTCPRIGAGGPRSHPV